MSENKQKDLPDYLEIVVGDTVYKVSSIYASKGSFRTLLEELIISQATRRCDCKIA